MGMLELLNISLESLTNIWDLPGPTKEFLFFGLGLLKETDLYFFGSCEYFSLFL
jgi:hypothetical protein